MLKLTEMAEKEIFGDAYCADITSTEKEVKVAQYEGNTDFDVYRDNKIGGYILIIKSIFPYCDHKKTIRFFIGDQIKFLKLIIDKLINGDIYLSDPKDDEEFFSNPDNQ